MGKICTRYFAFWPFKAVLIFAESSSSMSCQQPFSTYIVHTKMRPTVMKDERFLLFSFSLILSTLHSHRTWESLPYMVSVRSGSSDSSGTTSVTTSGTTATVSGGHQLHWSSSSCDQRWSVSYLCTTAWNSNFWSWKCWRTWLSVSSLANISLSSASR